MSTLKMVLHGEKTLKTAIQKNFRILAEAASILVKTYSIGSFSVYITLS